MFSLFGSRISTSEFNAEARLRAYHLVPKDFLMRNLLGPLLVLLTICALIVSAHADEQAGGRPEVKSHDRGTPGVARQDVGKRESGRSDTKQPDASRHNVGAHDALQELLSQSRAAYYSLAKHGFKGFTATIEPNWEVILAHTATPENLDVFRAIRFSMIVDANGAVRTNREVNAIILTPRMETVVNDIHYHLHRLVAGFFGTWRTFMVDVPFPDSNTPIKLEKLGEHYRLTYSIEPGEVMVLMTDELLITEWRLVSPRAKRIVKPHFQKTDAGFLLTGYQGIFEPIIAGNKSALDFTIEYQDVGGMKLPHRVRLGGMYGDEPVEAELLFKVN